MKLLIDEFGRKILFDENKFPQEMNTDLGIIKKSDVLAASPGAKIKTHKGRELLVVEPTFIDLFENIQRGPQIITVKDAAMIASYANISSNSRVVEAGTGSGALTCFLANLVRPNGKVFTYEIREDFIKIAKENIKMFGLENFVEIRNRSVYEGIIEENIDAVTLDIPEPWRVIPSAEKALKMNGTFVSYLPTITQVSALCEFLNKSKLRVFKVCEILERDWKVRGRIIRPENLMLGHTGFLVFARKLSI